jgi:hypothetical protein
MDEKGIQMGGGRKNNGRVYMYFRDQKNRYYKIGSDNLESFTVFLQMGNPFRHLSFTMTGNHAMRCSGN